jgi:Family of unknown function (DUF5681)
MNLEDEQKISKTAETQIDDADDRPGDTDQLSAGLKFAGRTSVKQKVKPKKPPKPQDILWEELQKPVTIRKGGKEKRVARLEAIYLQLDALVMAGNSGATRLYRQLLEQARLRKRLYKEEEVEPACHSLTEQDFDKVLQIIDDLFKPVEKANDDDGKAVGDDTATKPQELMDKIDHTSMEDDSMLPTIDEITPKSEKENDHD